MNRKQLNVVLAGMLALALAGCGTMRGSKMPEDGAGTTSSGTSSTMGTGAAGGSSSTTGTGDTGPTGSTTGSEGGAGSMAGTASGSTASPQSQGTTGAPAAGTMTPNAMVMAIEALPKQGTGAVGGSGAGTTGSSMGEEKTYRVTLRMDDGTTLVVTQATPPTFRMGDRVNMTDGAISH